ncbi:phage virion morphogenesis protein [Sphingobium cloacae]|uniref:Phage virion morphogenesis protein n=1 Tax=Sphingobium cloacae TaxID=120107 RepID=A0A1E1F2U7_9SPHN|nr:phage virion morphogenesis protein [Sphingobium cloacae]BAV64772.1 phage virion morphogenesis protein [Sphingobium cloacae]
MIGVQFKYEDVAEALRELSARLDDMTPVHEDIGEYVLETTKERFRKGIAPDGTPWAPKSAATLAAYLARGDGDRPDPLIGPSRRLSSEIQRIASPDSVEIGSSLEYSGAMQDGVRKGAFGTNSRGNPIPWGDIPARVWLGLSEEDESEIIDIADEYLAEAFEKRGFNTARL